MHHASCCCCWFHAHRLTKIGIYGIEGKRETNKKVYRLNHKTDEHKQCACILVELVCEMERCVFVLSLCRRRHVFVCWLSIIVELVYDFFLTLFTSLFLPHRTSIAHQLLSMCLGSEALKNDIVHAIHYLILSLLFMIQCISYRFEWRTMRSICSYVSADVYLYGASFFSSQFGLFCALFASSLVCVLFFTFRLPTRIEKRNEMEKKERQTQHTSAHKRILIFSAYFAFGPWCLLLWCLWRLLNLTLRKEHVRTVQRCNEQFSNYNEYPTKSEIWTKFKIHTNRFSFGTLLLFIRLYFVLRYNSQNFFFVRLFVA